MPVKLRNKPLPRQPITLTTRWEYSYVGGGYVPPKVTTEDLTSLLDEDYNEDDLVQDLVTGAPSEDLPWEDGDDLSDLTLEGEQ
jgi:hypothetical protein